MKQRSHLFALALLLVAAVATPLRAEFKSVVEITDLRGNSKFEVCTDAEKKKYEAEIRDEAKVFAKTLEETKTEWKALHKDSPFPSSRIKQRTIRVITSTPNAEEADKAVSKAESHESRALDSNKRDQERILNMKPTRSRRGGSNAANVSRMQADVKEDRARDADADKAEESLRKKLSAAVGHEVPFYGETPAEQKPAPKKKK